MRSGVPEEKIIVAPSRDTERQRTYESAVAVFRALEARGIHPKTLNVFTLGPHARRSRLVFAKVLRPGTEVGVVDWIPSDDQTSPWWQSSDRAKDLLTETAGYVYEALFNSGRASTLSVKAHPPDSLRNFALNFFLLVAVSSFSEKKGGRRRPLIFGQDFWFIETRPRLAQVTAFVALRCWKPQTTDLKIKNGVRACSRNPALSLRASAS